MLDTADWYTPIDGTAAPRPVAPTPDEMFLRVERETLRRFPDTGCILFTIRTYVAPVLTACATSEATERLASAIEALPDDVLAYKDLVSTATELATTLRPPVDNQLS